MMNPYRVLGIAGDDAEDDEAIRRAYLDGLRAHPPDIDPEGFQRLRDAYEQIASQHRRLAFELFTAELPTGTSVATHALTPGQPQRPSVTTLRAALAAGLRTG